MTHPSRSQIHARRQRVPVLGLGVFASCLAFGSVAYAADDDARAEQRVALSPSDFAWGLPLTAKPGLALQTLLLPQQVLESCDVEREQLGVFNAAGEAVPHAVRELSTQGEATPALVEVPVFPIRRAADPAVAPAPLTVQVQRRADGSLTTVSVDMAQPAATTTATTAGPIASYILDTSQLPKGVERLRFELSGEPLTFVWPLRVEVSADLDSFTFVQHRGSLATLQHAGHSVVQRELPLSGLSAKYIRLSWSGEAPAQIVRVSAVLEGDRPRLPLVSRELQSEGAGSATERTFDLGAALPLYSLDLVLQKNTVIQAEILGRSTPDGAEVRLAEGTFYALEHDQDLLHNEPFTIRQGKYRSLRVRVADKGGGLGSSPLGLRVQSIPEQLLFVARGEGPFQLAFGRAGQTPSAFSAGELLGLTSNSTAALAEQSVEVGIVRELGGEQALHPPVVTNYRKPVLWAVLVLAVGFLGLLSVRLLRRVDREQTP